MQIYDTIGRGYGALRRQDPRIARQIVDALGESVSVLNVGAGAGSYEPHDRALIAVEPSRVMIRQRPAGAAPVVRAVAGALPFAENAFDAALAILTIHHWSDLEAGLHELRRIAAKRVVLLTSDPGLDGFWLLDYFPEIAEIDRAWMPTLDTLADLMGPIDVAPVAVPHDCIDGFLGAYWRRPAAYLDPETRKAISSFTKIERVEEGVEALRSDLESGEWERRYSELQDRDAIDIGYRLVVASAA